MKIDLSDSRPIYLQIIDGFRAAILSGRYRDGDRVPPVRELAIRLKINPNTVAKAYKMMQDEQLLASRPGGGNFITLNGETDLKREREACVAETIARLIAEADAFGLSRDQLRRLFEQKMEEHHE